MKISIPQDSLLKTITGDDNCCRYRKAVKIINRSDGWIDLSNVCLSTMIARALRQYDRINDDFVRSFSEIFDAANLDQRTELSQIVVAAESARIFLNSFFSLSCSSSINHRKVWTIIEEMGKILERLNMPEKIHWSRCADIDTLKLQLRMELDPKLLLRECCSHLISLEQGGLQHPLALPVFNKKHRGRRNRSLSHINDEDYANLHELVVNCDYIFDFPVLSEEKFLDANEHCQ